MQITTIGLDIAKHVFQVHGIDASEKVVVRKQLCTVEGIGSLLSSSRRCEPPPLYSLVGRALRRLPAHQFDDARWDRWWVYCPNSAVLTMIGALQNCGCPATTS